MRNAFAAEIQALAAENDRVVLLSGDIGNRLFDPFKARFGRRFFNCGVAEANMTGVAAGMALCGLRPVTYTITPFNTVRCLEQIRVDVCYQRLPVVIVGVGAGLAYAGLGGTHQSCEDIALLRALPHMTVVCPADACEVRLSLRAALAHDGPVYLRLGKKNEPAVHQRPPAFAIGRVIVLQTGHDLCLAGTGNIVAAACEAADKLGQDGLSVQVADVHTVKPLDQDFLQDAFARFPLVVTVEEHSRIGGLGAAVAEWMADCGPTSGRLLRLGIDDQFIHRSGGQANARRMAGISAGQIADRVRRALGR